jgi:acyl-CoA thioesterase-1
MSGTQCHSVLRAAVVGCVAVALVLATAGPAAAATVHIVAFGDSATAGYLVPHRDAYPAQLQAALRAKGHDVRVLNAGRNGDTTFGALERIDTAVPPNTDIVIVEFGTNDRRYRTPLHTVRANLDQLLRRLNERHMLTLVIALAPLQLSRVAHANGALYVAWRLPPGQFRARDGHHYSRQGYAIVVARMLPAVELLVKRAAHRKH